MLVHKPNKEKGYYGATVAAPVFKEIARKMYYTTPKEVVIEAIASEPTTFDLSKIEQSLANQKIPNLKGLPAMEALVLLEKTGLK